MTTTKRLYKSTEKGTQDAVCEYLSLLQRQNKLFFWRNNTTGVYDASAQTFRAQHKYALNGQPDIIIVKNGYVVFVEVKDVKGRLSENQKHFQELCKKNGAEYHVIRKIDELLELGLQN